MRSEGGEGGCWKSGGGGCCCVTMLIGSRIQNEVMSFFRGILFNRPRRRTQGRRRGPGTSNFSFKNSRIARVFPVRAIYARFIQKTTPFGAPLPPVPDYICKGDATATVSTTHNIQRPRNNNNFDGGGGGHNRGSCKYLFWLLFKTRRGLFERRQHFGRWGWGRRVPPSHPPTPEESGMQKVSEERSLLNVTLVLDETAASGAK